MVLDSETWKTTHYGLRMEVLGDVMCLVQVVQRSTPNTNAWLIERVPIYGLAILQRHPRW